MVKPTQRTSASARKTVRKAHPERRGSSARLWAIWTWKGFSGLKAEATKAGPALMATATRGVKPRVRVRTRRGGMSATISSCMFWVAPPPAKKRATAGITQRSRPWKRRTSQETPRFSVPVCSTTLKAPPMRKTRKMTSPASSMPRGRATMASKKPTGSGSTSW